MHDMNILHSFLIKNIKMKRGKLSGVSFTDSASWSNRLSLIPQHLVMHSQLIVDENIIFF